MRTPSSIELTFPTSLLDGEAADFYREDVVSRVQFPWGDLVRGEAPHLGCSSERVAVRLYLNIGGSEELAEQCLDSESRPATELGPIWIDHRRSGHGDKQRAPGSEHPMKFPCKCVGVIH